MPKGTRGRAHCKMEGCDKLVEGHGLCKAHYLRWKRHGDPLAGGPRCMQGHTVEERLLAKTNKNGPIPDYAPHLGPCWLWTGALEYGYGQLGVEGKSKWAYRVAYELFVGQVGTGLQLDHLCRVRACVNPTHLEPVTQAENIRRGESGAHQKAKTHCPHGHPYDEENTFISNRGYRNCRVCMRIKKRAAKARKKERDAANAGCSSQ